MSLRETLAKLGVLALDVVDTRNGGGRLAILHEAGPGPDEDAAKRAADEATKGLDWHIPYHLAYPGELRRLLRIEGEAEPMAIAQVPVFLPGPETRVADIRLELEPDDFAAPHIVEAVLAAHKARAGSRIFFNGNNARLLSANAQVFRFQGSRYFDYAATNLALDHGDGVAATLRERIHGQGRLEPLDQSPLANSAGINGLVFTADGFLVLQRRGPRVLIMAGQICPGFSGMIDRIDIERGVARGGRLLDLDATREMVEETGAPAEGVRDLRFLGVTRELIRGGAPELFFAVDLDITRRDLVARQPRDPEGDLLFVDLGSLGRAAGPADAASISFAELMARIAASVTGKLALPLITNLVLWRRSGLREAG